MTGTLSQCSVTRVIAFSLLSMLILPTQGVEGRNRFTKLSTKQIEDDYYVILRRVFHRLYDGDVVVAELFAVGSGDVENATGVLKTAKGYRVLALFSGPSVWNIFEQGFEEHCIDETGKVIPCGPKARPKGAPRSYRDVKVVMKTRRLSNDLAARIVRVWQQRVREALRRPVLTDEERGYIGGSKHYYSVRLSGGNWSTVLGQTGGENTDTERMATLADAMRGYATGEDSENAITTALKPLEAP